MRVRRRQKSKKVRRSHGRSNSSGAFHDTPKKFNTSLLNCSDKRKRKVLSKKLRRKIERKAKKSAVITLSTLCTAMEAQHSTMGISNPAARSYSMEEIWNKACRYYEIPDDVASSWFTRIQQRLSHDTVARHYHNWQELLVSKQELLHDCKPSVVLAAFFQYYAFDGRLTCVAQNCEAFNEFCRDADLQDADTKQLILTLLGDKSSAAICCFDDEANQLQDMDLMILGSTPEEYKRYTQLLRQEYISLNDVEYKQMRLKVLKTLLLIPNIFACPEFQAKYEQLARTNIMQEIEELKQ